MEAAWMNCGWRAGRRKSGGIGSGTSGGRRVKENVRNALGGGNTCGRRTSGRLAECIRQAARTGENQSLFDGAGYVPSWDADACIRPDLGLAGLPEDLSGRKVLIIGEQVIAGSLRCCLWEEWGADQVTVLCPTEGEKALASGG